MGAERTGMGGVKMNKFKFGDKVRRILPGWKDVKQGKIYTVLSQVGINLYLKETEYPDYGFSVRAFELVSEAKSELEQLVETANAGLQALIKLEPMRKKLKWKNYRLPYVDVGGSSRIFNAIADREGDLVLGIVSEPKFTPYKTKDEGYEVKLEENIIYVGCASFSLETLKAALRALLYDNAVQAYKSEDFRATRNGITHPKGSITWASAEELYEKIKDL